MDGADRAADADLIVYADYVCPYCYLAEAALAPVRAQGVRVDARAFELRPAPQPLPSMSEPCYTAAWERHVVPLADELGVRGMLRPRFATRTRKAHEAALFAHAHGAGDEMRVALYRAYFEEQQDIGRIDVLLELGGGIGLDRAALKIELDIDQYTDAVVAMSAAALERGISAVPAYVIPGVEPRGRVVLGVRSSDEVRALLADDVTVRVNGDME